MNANEFFSKIIAVATPPIKRTINIVGESQDIYIRRISASDRIKLTPGNRIAVGANAGSTEFTLQDLINKQHLLVQLAIVDSNGGKLFQNIDDVARLPDVLVKELHKYAEEVNKEVEEVGKPE